ncbi:MAG: hypothetical protein ACREA0_19360 [bacterium]
MLGAALALGAACVFIGIKAYKTFYYAGSKEEKPQLYAVPRPLALTPCTVERTTTLSYSGLSVDLPWTGIVDEKQYDKFNRFRFDSGLAVLFGKIDETHGPIAMFREQDAETQRGLEAMLGREATGSQYGFYEAMLNTTPENITLDTHPSRVIGLRMILLMKEIMLPTGNAELYSFHTESVKGFQIGGGYRRSVELLAFDSPHGA